MTRLLLLKPRTAFICYAVLNTIFVAIGMGVPVLSIVFGFFIGWYIVKSLIRDAVEVGPLLGEVLKRALLCSAITFILMAVLWGPAVTRLLDPNVDHAKFGMPMILFEPLASFVGWLTLMIFISPFLQLLTIVFAAYWTLWHISEKGMHDEQTGTVSLFFNGVRRVSAPRRDHDGCRATSPP